MGVRDTLPRVWHDRELWYLREVHTQGPNRRRIGGIHATGQ